MNDVVGRDEFSVQGSHRESKIGTLSAHKRTQKNTQFGDNVNAELAKGAWKMNTDLNEIKLKYHTTKMIILN